MIKQNKTKLKLWFTSNKEESGNLTFELPKRRKEIVKFEFCFSDQNVIMN